MFSPSQLTEDQKAAIHQWAADGATIADIQKRLNDDFDIKMTYMDARFLVLDLDVKLVEPKEDEKPAEPVLDEATATPNPTGQVSVTLDSVAVPGAMVSGKVTFSDGENATWMIDQYGRPGLDPTTPGYRPSPEDIESFQKQLTDLMGKQGL